MLTLCPIQCGIGRDTVFARRGGCLTKAEGHWHMAGHWPWKTLVRVFRVLNRAWIRRSSWMNRLVKTSLGEEITPAAGKNPEMIQERTHSQSQVPSKCLCTFLGSWPVEKDLMTWLLGSLSDQCAMTRLGVCLLSIDILTTQGSCSWTPSLFKYPA